ncbi:MAG: RluA family pseudouridine synthase [Kiritimatiellia bacterium]
MYPKSTDSSTTQKPKVAIVTRGEDGFTLQDFLAERLKVTKRASKAMIDARVVWINRKLTWMARHTLVAGDQVAFVVTQSTGAKQSKAKDVCPHIRVLWQDEWYLAADKPAGFLTQGKDSIEFLLGVQEHLPTLQAVHRLDRETSGVLLFAKTPAALNAAIAMFKTHRVTKCYNAIAAGNVESESSTLNETLDGERAVTHLRRLQSNAEASFLTLRIETGRTHQIRRHLSGIRHPIIGDRQYGVKNTNDPRVFSVTRQMLHSVELELPHPMVVGLHIKVHSPLPADFRSALKLFGLGKR